MIDTHRGHEIATVDGVWVYKDTQEPVEQNPARPCGHCGLANTDEGHDGCLGTLPGLMNACCGHGRVVDAYVQYWDGSDIRGLKAQRIIEGLKMTEPIHHIVHRILEENGVFSLDDWILILGGKSLISHEDLNLWARGVKDVPPNLLLMMINVVTDNSLINPELQTWVKEAVRTNRQLSDYLLTVHVEAYRNVLRTVPLRNRDEANAAAAEAARKFRPA